MNTAIHYHLAGMGAVTGSQIAYAGVNAVGGALLTAAPFTGPAAPFVAIAGAAVELLGALASALGIGKGCGQTCITASNYANQAEPLLQQNLNTYLGLSAPRYKSAQTAALNVFDSIWAGLKQACGNPALNTAGQNCIGDRQQGACHYQVAPGPGCTNSAPTCWVQDANGNWNIQWGGGQGSGSACWNWFIGYRDPIANDPTVVPDPVASTTSASSISSAASSLIPSSSSVASSFGGIDPTLLLIGAGVALFMVMNS